MYKKRPLCIGLSLSATWMKGDGWRRQDSKAEQLNSSDFYIGLAQKAERAKLDFVFKPDALYVNVEALERSPGFGGLDPTLLLTSLAHATSRIGLITTVSSTFLPPYLVARQLQSLHWISDGRAGWNVVTALGGAENFTAAGMPSSEERYARAEEFAELVMELWESFPHDALRIDRATGRFADSQRVRPVSHEGTFFHVKGPLNIPAHPAGPLPVLQAGASENGRRFAAAYADAVFAAAPEAAAAIELRDDLRRRAVALGRAPDAVRVLPGLYFFLAPTREEARAQYAEAHTHVSAERRHAAIEAALGLNLRGLDPAEPVTAELLPDPALPVRDRTYTAALRALIVSRQPTVAELLERPEVIGSLHWVVIGTPADVLRQIVDWHEAGAMDGFIALPGGSLQSLDLLLEELVPMLAELGLYRREYAGATLREHLGVE
ncbi:NtaA/DmoA family FMN-dependent monooxygenase [Paenibacillus sp. IB182496]|uniref:NtaA/DmoA family FMN-dependent monooxygenase n=1 Tax=Paenibacillus sabuli TaxID=2772509 RepID=A0A927BSB8_9BACL|nr:NtaA/DmoA family FMN-dependent monooxygenase [Paenibacillus sabuli]MBD2845016.1 NtaA/DmoA family FMN-dependent monooxygenase [Paenibacillus sabuli]